MLEQRLDYKPLETFVTNLDPYINEKISVAIFGKDKDISAAYTSVKKNMYDLINALKVLFNSYTLKANKSAQDRKNMDLLANKFELYADLFKKDQENLQKIRNKTVLGDKKEAIDIITELARQLEAVAHDASLDYQSMILTVTE